jgi:DNA-binding IclR family transcriptional regulator
VTRSPSSAVDKALDLVEAVARSEQPRRLSDLAEEVGLHRVTAYRVLLDLVRRGWVLRHGDHYLPGTVVLQLSRAAAAQSLVAVGRPVLTELAQQTTMMTNLQVLEPDGARVLDVVRPARYKLIDELRGELLPVHRFAGPLALVSALDDALAEHYLQLAAKAGHPIDGPEGLRAEIATTRERGYAFEQGRSQDVIASVSQAVLAPKGGPLCALTVVGLTTEFDEQTLAGLVRQLDAATADLRRRLTEPTYHSAADGDNE